VEQQQGGSADPVDLAVCLRVLRRLADRPDDPALAAVHEAVQRAYRSGKKHRKVARRGERRERDQAVVATTRRYREEVPPTDPVPAPDRAAVLLHHGRRCYVCGAPYRVLDAEYHALCPDCAAENAARRFARCDLSGRRAVVTGGRTKIGFHTALKLLRDGAEVLVTTRFPRDAARRYAAVPDAARWLHRLHVHGVDFLDLPAVLGFIDAIGERWRHLDILVNNAAQTVHRPPGYHRDVHAAELEALHGTAATVALTGTAAAPGDADAMLPAAVDALFPAGRVDETGEPLDLRDTNSWTLGVGEVSPREWLATQVVNAFVPFLLTGRLRPLLSAAPQPDRYVVQVSAMEGSFSRYGKTSRHPHTNMAKAALNMLTRTVATGYAADGIYMTSVDTGWITDERPYPGKTAQRATGFRPPLDVIDGAARVYDPIVRGVSGAPVYGVFLKDYRPVEW
jgi:NAD(P)-dependent dehydrogenase (short-subunit alcohol dehydrogenase family)